MRVIRTTGTKYEVTASAEKWVVVVEVEGLVKERRDLPESNYSVCITKR
jgi:hypothetical protein